jgi:hypothetical protein
VETDRIKNIFHIEAIFLTAHKEDFSMEAESKQVPTPSIPQYPGVFSIEPNPSSHCCGSGVRSGYASRACKSGSVYISTKCKEANLYFFQKILIRLLKNI